MLAPWIISTFTVVAVYFLDRWENKYIKSLFDWVPAILLAYIIPALISFLLDVDYSQNDIHNFSKDYFIPLAIVAVMSSLSLGQLKAIGWKPIVVFLAGSLFIAVFPVLLGLSLLDTDLVAKILIDQEYWKGVPPIVGSWIGGSTSQLVLKELVECPENIFLSVLVMDNILVNIWTILMFQTIKKSKFLNRRFQITDIAMPEDMRFETKNQISPWLCGLILLTTVIVSNFSIDSFIGRVVVLSFLGLALSNFIPKWNFKFTLKIGSILIIIVMAVLGLKLQFATLGFNTAFLGFFNGLAFRSFYIYGICRKAIECKYGMGAYS